MFNLVEYKKRQVNNKKFKRLLEKTNGNKFYQFLANKYNATCTHGLLMHFGKTTWDEPNKGYEVCLCCGRKFDLSNPNDNKEVLMKNLLNISWEVSEDNLYALNEEGIEIMVMKAQEILNELAKTKTEISYGELQLYMAELLIAYDKDLLTQKERVLPERK